MPKKKSSKEKSLPTRKNINLPRDLLKTMFGEWNKNRHLLDQIGFPPGPTKSWLREASSRPCIYNKQPQHPQLTELTTDSTTNYDYDRYSYDILPEKQWYFTPQGNENILTVTNRVSKVDISTWWRRRREKRSIKHEITTIDRYDSENRVMKFTNVVECDGKFYALSLQGSLGVMEEDNDARLTITGICRTRAVPSCSVSAKYFNRYLIESRREVLLVFLIYRETIGIVDEIEVLKLDFDRLELVKVDRLQGRSLFLEEKYCMWVDSREIGCKGDCVYFFTGELGNHRWWMYDMETRSISMDEPRME